MERLERRPDRERLVGGTDDPGVDFAGRKETRGNALRSVSSGERRHAWIGHIRRGRSLRRSWLDRPNRCRRSPRCATPAKNGRSSATICSRRATTWRVAEPYESSSRQLLAVAPEKCGKHEPAHAKFAERNGDEPRQDRDPEPVERHPIPTGERDAERVRGERGQPPPRARRALEGEWSEQPERAAEKQTPPRRSEARSPGLAPWRSEPGGAGY